MAALPAARGLSGPCLKSAVVVAALLVGCAPGVAAGGVGEAVAGALAEPVLRGVRHWRSINETTGTEPFLQSFINGQIVSYVNSCQPEYLLADGAPDCDEIEGDCADSGEACEYVYAIESLVVAGAIMGVLLVAAFISSLLVSACCGARLRHAAWDSGLAGSGGAALVAKTHHRASFYLVPLLAAVVALNTLLGFVAGLEMGQDVLDLLEGVKTATKVPEDVRARADWALLKVSLLREDFLRDQAELRVSPGEGLSELRADLDAMRAALTTLQSSALDLEQFVEGCKAGPGQCGGGSSDWNLCVYSTTQDNGSHPVGVGVTLSNGRSSPACRNPVSGAPAACPCCAACHRLSEMVDATLAAMPGDRDVDALNVTYPPEEILGAATATVDQYRPSIQSVMESLAPVNASMVEAQGEVTAQMYKLVAADSVLWMPAAGVLACVGAALYRTMARAPREPDVSDESDDGQGTPMRDEGKHAEEERKGAALWYLHVAFYGGLAVSALLAAPVFALLSIGTLPLSDVCLIIPATNESASALLRLLEVPDAVDASSFAAAARAVAVSAAALALPTHSAARAGPSGAAAALAEVRGFAEHVRPGAGGAGGARGGDARSQTVGVGAEALRRGVGGRTRVRFDMEAVLREEVAHGWRGRVGGLGERAGEEDVFPPADGEDDDGGGSLPRRLIEDCLCRPEGSAWGVLGVGDDAMKAHLNIRNASQALPASLRSTALSMLRYEALSDIYLLSSLLTSASDVADEALGITDCATADATAFPTCAEDMDVYVHDLAPLQLQLRVAGTNLQRALGDLQDTTLAVQQNVTRLMALSDYYTDAMHKVVWEAGSCDMLHARYENVRRPLCNGVVDAILAVWASLFISVPLWACLLLAVCVMMGAVHASLPSRRLSFGESDYSLLLDIAQEQEGGLQD